LIVNFKGESVYLKRLEVSGLRNIDHLKCSFDPGLSIILGKNGQGKTSVLEAIFLLSHARSFRTSSIKEIVKYGSLSGEPNFATAYIETNLGEFEILINIHKGKRELLVNQKRVTRAGDFCGLLKTVLFTPEDLELVKGSPVIRRQFLDRVLVMLEPNLMNTLGEYSKVIKTRNVLLQEGDIRKANIFNEPLITLNLLIAKKRKEFIDGISDKVKEIYKKIANNSTDEEISLEYKSTFFRNNSIISIDEALRLFEENQTRDRKLGRTNLGTHKDELSLNFLSDFASGSSRIISSQGQARTIALCCKLASAEYIKLRTGEKPVLLLDDVDAELDEERRASLYNLLNKHEGQIFLTGTRMPAFREEDSDEDISGQNISQERHSKTKVFKLEKGVLSDPKILDYNELKTL